MGLERIQKIELKRKVNTHGYQFPELYSDKHREKSQAIALLLLRQNHRRISFPFVSKEGIFQLFAF